MTYLFDLLVVIVVISQIGDSVLAFLGSWHARLWSYIELILSVKIWIHDIGVVLVHVVVKVVALDMVGGEVLLLVLNTMRGEVTYLVDPIGIDILLR